MRYRVVLKHETLKLDRELSFQDWDIAEAHYNSLVKALITDKDVFGNYSLRLIRDGENGKILMEMQKDL